MKTSRIYLRRLHMAAFGRFFDASVGPFSAGLNVVYGENETGKTTLNAFIGGVLFGWEKAHGGRNVYRPKSAERSGTLFFVDAETGEECEVSRTRNVDGPSFSPEKASALLDAIDKDTFSTMFALTSDELRGLEGATDVTAKLLTAGAGLEVSPASVLAALDKEIASYMSRSSAASHSFVNLAAEEEECKHLIAHAREQSDALKDEYREYEELVGMHDAASADIADMNARIESIASARLEVARLEEVERDSRRRMDECDARLAAEEASRPVSAAPLFDEEAETAALAQIERLESEKARIENRLDAARDAFNRARAEVSVEEGPADGRKGMPSVSAALVLAAILSVVGLGLLAFAALRGETLVAFASALVVIAGVACGIAALRAGRRSRGVSRETSSVRAMSIARDVLGSCEQEDLLLSLRVKESLASMGLEGAHESLSRARDSVEASRARRLRAAERLRFRTEQGGIRARCEQEADRARALRESLLARCGISSGGGASALEQLEGSLRGRRDEAMNRMRVSDARTGELKQALQAGIRLNDYDVLKTRAAQIATRKEESSAELAELLLARRALEKALDAWKSESVPAAYRRASELLRLMTNEKWQRVLMDEDGALVAVDAVGRRFDPRFLSMGTCQQLYLALRIALLECAADVGAGIPVLADDILVNFDDNRRVGAVKALAELARSRQVILFTCHKEILDAVKRYAADCTVVAL